MYLTYDRQQIFSTHVQTCILCADFHRLIYNHRLWNSFCSSFHKLNILLSLIRAHKSLVNKRRLQVADWRSGMHAERLVMKIYAQIMKHYWEDWLVDDQTNYCVFKNCLDIDTQGYDLLILWQPACSNILLLMLFIYIQRNINCMGVQTKKSTAWFNTWIPGYNLQCYSMTLSGCSGNIIHVFTAR